MLVHRDPVISLSARIYAGIEPVANSAHVGRWFALMATFANRLSKIEESLGDDDVDRWIKALTDEELEAELAVLGAKARHDLELRGVPCADMDIKDVLDRLVEFDKLEAEHVNAA